MRRKSMLGVLLAGLTLAATATASAQLRVEVRDRQFTVNEMTPGGQVAVVGVVADGAGLLAALSAPAFFLTDDDADGIAEGFFEEDVPPQSVFVAADIQQEGEGWTAVDGLPRTSEVGVTLSVADDPTSGRPTLHLRGGSLAVMIVRTGVGAWKTHLVDGGSRDSDGAADGDIGFTPEAFVSSTPGAPVLDAFLEGDRFIAIDTHEQSITMGRITTENPRGSGGK